MIDLPFKLTQRGYWPPRYRSRSKLKRILKRPLFYDPQRDLIYEWVDLSHRPHRPIRGVELVASGIDPKLVRITYQQLETQQNGERL